MKKMKLEKAPGLLDVSMEMINACGKIRIDVMIKLCQRVFDGKGMPENWKTSVVVPIYKGKGDVTNCGAYRGVKLLKYGMKIVVRVLEKRIRALVKVDDIHYGFMPGRGTIDALLTVRRMQEKYREKKDKKLYMCFVDFEMALDRVPRRVIIEFQEPEILVKAVMSLYEGSKMKVKVGSEFLEKFYVAVAVHQESALSLLLFAIVMDVVTENTRKSLMKSFCAQKTWY